MTISSIILYTLLGLAVALCWFAGLGVLAARDAYARLQFTTPAATLASILFAAAVCMTDSAWQARLKAVLIALLLIGGNALVSHVTARAFQIRETKRLSAADVPAEPS